MTDRDRLYQDAAAIMADGTILTLNGTLYRRRRFTEDPRAKSVTTMTPLTARELHVLREYALARVGLGDSA